MTVSSHEIAFTLNGRTVAVEVAANMLLIDLLRDVFRLHGVKRSCDLQVCGVCTVLIDGAPVSSCTMLAVDADQRDVLTIEGVGTPDELDPIQEAFIRHGAVQCGYCTPGFILSAKALLAENPSPSRAEIIQHLKGNICRCTGYKKIIEAVESLV